MDKIAYIEDLYYLLSVPNKSKSEKIEKIKKESLREIKRVEKEMKRKDFLEALNKTEEQYQEFLLENRYYLEKKDFLHLELPILYKKVKFKLLYEKQITSFEEFEKEATLLYPFFEDIAHYLKEDPYHYFVEEMKKLSYAYFKDELVGEETIFINGEWRVLEEEGHLSLFDDDQMQVIQASSMENFIQEFFLNEKYVTWTDYKKKKAEDEIRKGGDKPYSHFFFNSEKKIGSYLFDDIYYR